MTSSIAVPSTEKNQMGGIARKLQAQQMGGGRAMMVAMMRGRGEPRQASPERALREHRAQKHPRFRIGDGKGLFLRLDGLGVTSNAKSAWIGSEAQLERALALFAHAKGMHGIQVVVAKAPVRAPAMEAWGAR